MQADDAAKTAATSSSASGSSSAVKKEKDSSSSSSSTKDGEKKRKAESVDDVKKKLKPTPSTSTSTKPTPTSTPSTSKPTPSSLFPSKPTTGLPSFKKKADATTAPASAGGSSLFQEAFAALQGKKATTPTAAAGGEGGSKKPVGKNGKQRKSVRWRPDAELVEVREIESRAERFGEGMGEDHDEQGNLTKLMEGEEGQVHALHLADEFDEEIDWYEPQDILIPPDARIEPPISPAMDLETTRQSSVAAFDLNTPLPSSPTEPTEAYTPTSTPLIIPLSVELRDDASVQATIAHAQASTTPLGGFAANEQIQTLLGQLTSAGFNAPPPQPQQSQSQWPQPLPHQQAFDQATINALASYSPS
ncbi:hypothetical protein BCR35DRAFT_75784 [Leucosporidium creatinivorum]|uniref:Uncharacterized protein n=1 Tax=Leucosporidium creatinivorum TaxID=106004 RepID=A0A1Y2G326_9BASI|nr:hypothetical protein BCR35DRAFT_75784 [Leucosporidium creatinivorum]